MMASHPASNDLTPQEWFSAAELAALALPGLPATKRAVNARAGEERWASRCDKDGELLARKRAGRGGGTEFHVSLLPGEARVELQRRGIVAADDQATPDAGASGWPWFERQSDKVKDEARRKLDIVREVTVLCEAGASKSAAIAEISAQAKVGTATIWNWMRDIDGIDPANWLPALAPRYQGGGTQADIDAELWREFIRDYLRLSKPTLTSCYRRVEAKAKEMGLSIPTQRTFSRRVKADLDPRLIKLKREGEEALRRSAPAQRRRIEELRVMEHVNIDGHRFDVFVEPPPGSRKKKPIRPMMVAIQDLRSSKIMAWRIAETECSAVTRLAFADLFRNWGIPAECTLDNGRAFASKWITGGAKSRFRFKVREEEPTGLLTGLGIKIHWALPYRGQSKPIERAFRDLCDTIAKHPAMEGAYTGNSPVSKPENYGKRAVPWDEFVEHVNRGIALHNAQTGRRGRDYAGRSFDQVYEELLEHSPVGKATPEQLRLALLAADQKMVNRQTGAIELYGNRYYSLGTSRLHGQKVTVRFDPEDLHSDIYLYDQQGRFLTEAHCMRDSGFSDAEGARATAKRTRELREDVRKGEESHRLLRSEEVAARQAQIREVPRPEPSVVRPVRMAGGAVAARKLKLEEEAEQQASVLDRMRIGRAKLSADNE